MSKKYKLLEDPEHQKRFNMRTCFRIQALKSFGDVSKGDIGGFVEYEECLSQDGNCWIYDDSAAIGNVRVSDNAYIGDESVLINVKNEDPLIVSGNARIINQSEISGSCQVRDNAVCDNISMTGQAQIYDNAQVSSHIKGNVRIYGYAKVKGGFIENQVEIHDNAEVAIGWNSNISGLTRIYNNAKVILDGGSIRISNSEISLNANISVDPKLHGSNYTGNFYINNSKIIGKYILTKNQKINDVDDEMESALNDIF